MTSEFEDVRIHVGYHKTGSTLLQENLFVEERGIWSSWPQSFYHQRVLLDRPDDGWAARVRGAFRPGIERARSAGLVPVLSCEALSGDIWRRGQANGYGNFHVVHLLAEAFPGAKVAIVHREQRSMIVSLYKHSLRSHWQFSLESFLDQAPLSRGMAPILNFGYLEYSWLVEAYHRAFGRQQVLALPFEGLRDDAPGWARSWQDFLGVPVSPTWFREETNPGMSATTTAIKRHANALIPSTAEPNRSRTGGLVNRLAGKVDGAVPASLRRRGDRALRGQVDRAVGTRFHEDNARLFGVLGTSWRELGYQDGSPARHIGGANPQRDV